ncbi:MAG: hypothetical protein ACRDH2_17360, partial [Anaerolineales bacterium]
YRLMPEGAQVLVDLRWRIENLPEANDMLPYVRLYDLWGNEWGQSGGFSYPSEQWSPGDALLTRVSVPLPPGLPPGLYSIKAGLYSASTQTSLPRLDANGGFVGERAPLSEIQLNGGPPGQVEVFVAANPMAAPAQNPLNGDLALLGYRVNTTTPRQGERVQLTLFWHAPAPIAADSLSITLDEQLLFTGQPVQDTFPFADWQPGQLLIDHYTLKIPTDLRPAPAELRVNVSGYGAAMLDTLEVQTVARNFTPPEAITEIKSDLNHEIVLYGYQLTPGITTTITLVWQSLTPTDSDYTVFVHVLDPSGQILAQADAQPRRGAHPTSLWVPGEFVTDDYTFNLGRGSYLIEVGLYRVEDGTRLPVLDSSGQPIGDAIHLPLFQLS